MDEDRTAPPSLETNTSFPTVQKNLVQTELSLRVWDCQVNTLPQNVIYECENTHLLQYLYYPYWRLNLDATVKTLWLSPRQLSFPTSVDAVTGQPCVVLADEKPSIVDGRGTPTYIVPDAVAMKDIDYERVYQTMRLLVSKRIRAWSNLHLKIQDGGALIYKRIDLYAVTLKCGTESFIALDTISGKYGVIDSATVQH